MPNPGRAKRLLLLACALVPCACKPCAKVPPCSGAVIQISYHEHSGPVADPYSEELAISGSTIRFERTGETNGSINVVDWKFDIDAGSVDDLFETLGSADTTQIREIQPEEVPCGGGSKSYRIEYEDGCTVGLYYQKGTTYTGAQAIKAAIDGFIAGVRLPKDAFAVMR